ncbi:MAG: hypothetical protein FD166_78 [Bacteroidetes bacterium]|nr:MAG: hypothetical protein FD166_78 [Bacteroidota bacterium]
MDLLDEIKIHNYFIVSLAHTQIKKSAVTGYLKHPV